MKIEMVLILLTSSFFLLAIILRLIDFSAVKFLNKGIIVENYTVETRTIKKEFLLTKDKLFKSQLCRILIMRRIHDCSIFLCITCLFLFLLFAVF